MYEQAIRLDPACGLAWRMKGYTLRALKRYEEALAAYEQAISLDATDAEASTGKGNTLYDLKRYSVNGKTLTTHCILKQTAHLATTKNSAAVHYRVLDFP